MWIQTGERRHRGLRATLLPDCLLGGVWSSTCPPVHLSLRDVMEVLTSCLYGAVIGLAVLGLTSAGVSRDVTFRVKEDVVLPCKVPKTSALRVLEWKKDGMGSDYVFYFRDNSALESFQNEMYRGRVKLQDPQMTDGNMAIVLSNPSLSDAGTYTCHVATDTETTQTVRLRVEEPSNLGLAVGLPVGLVVVAAVAAIGGFLYVRAKKNGSTL